MDLGFYSEKERSLINLSDFDENHQQQYNRYFKFTKSIKGEDASKVQKTHKVNLYFFDYWTFSLA